ncbi:MAG: peptidoglycan DD-metalloendopeptidase family protein [Gammaproteobacteria bacterium]
MKQCALALLAGLMLLSCGGNQAIAPVSSKDLASDSQPISNSPAVAAVTPAAQPANKTAFHQVRTGDTLYSIAATYGYEARQVAEWNKLQPPYPIYRGQLLQVVPPKAAMIVRRPSSGAVPPPLTSSGIAATPPASVLDTPVASVPRTGLADSTLLWRWPTQGALIQGFSLTEKGLSIAGKEAQQIHAAAAGRVVYRGSGLIGLGELVIIKHDKSFLSAYAHNKKILVKEGDQVRLGQPIAEMGKTGAERVMLYFEIRKDGKPVDPLLYLPAKN